MRRRRPEKREILPDPIFGEVMVQNMMHGEALEGIGAFLEKRLPKWPEKQ